MNETHKSPMLKRNTFFPGRAKEERSNRGSLHFHSATSIKVSLPLCIEIPVSAERQPQERSIEKNLTFVAWLTFWFPA